MQTIRIAIRFLFTFAVTLPSGAIAQATPIPVRQLAPPITATERFRALPTAYQLPNGNTLVNDAAGKRALVFDPTLATFAVSADASGSAPFAYPAQILSNVLIPYLGDTLLYTDMESLAFVLIDPFGKFGRAMAHPNARDLSTIFMANAGNPAADPSGRIIYRAMKLTRLPDRPGSPPSPATRDTIPLVRVDFTSRAVDTIAAFSVPRVTAAVITDTDGAKPHGTLQVNPVPAAPDDWTVTSDGRVAILRAHDYHIDWILPNGEARHDAKLPFDWRRLTDEDKQARIDSLKRVVDSIAATGRPYGRIVRYNAAGLTDTIIPRIVYASLADIPDYVPPIRAGALKADRDGNVWILPATSSQARGGLLYDVVNAAGELFQRVQIPSNRVIAGLGRGGVVYLGHFDRDTKQWTLERTHILR